MKNYQLNYASLCDKMYDKISREEKAKRIIKTLEDYYGSQKLGKLAVLDVASSTGIIANSLAKRFNSVTGVDIDNDAVKYAKLKFKRRNLKFEVGDGLHLKYKNDSFDVVIATHVYEHVTNPQKLFDEIYRVLKTGGICYLAAINKWWPIEPHYHLPFLGPIPKKLANRYLNLMRGIPIYYETPKSFWELRNLLTKFKIIDYTPKILQNPTRFGYKPHSVLIIATHPILKYFVPTFFWILVKE